MSMDTKSLITLLSSTFPKAAGVKSNKSAVSLRYLKSVVKGMCEMNKETSTIFLNLKESVEKIDEHGLEETTSIRMQDLQELVQFLWNANKAGTKMFMDYKKDIKKSKQVLELVRDYLNIQAQVDDLADVLHLLLISVRRRHLRVKKSVRKLCEEEGNFQRTMQRLKEFQVYNEEPFGTELAHLFQSLQNKQLKLLQKMGDKKKEQDNIFLLLFGCQAQDNIFFVLFGCQALAVLLLAFLGGVLPHSLENLVKVVAALVGSTGKDEKENICPMRSKMNVSIREAEEIREVVKELQSRMEKMNVDIVVDRENLRDVVERIGILESEFLDKIEELDRLITRAEIECDKGRDVILKRVL